MNDAGWRWTEFCQVGDTRSSSRCVDQTLPSGTLTRTVGSTCWYQNAIEMVRIRFEATLTILRSGDGHALASYGSVNALREFSPSPTKPARSSKIWRPWIQNRMSLGVWLNWENSESQPNVVLGRVPVKTLMWSVNFWSCYRGKTL